MLDPKNLLAQVEPDLCRVLASAYNASPSFRVIQGLRTISAEQAAVNSGHSTTMHSRHLPDKAGLAAAVDVAALVNGVVNFGAGREAEVFTPIADQIKAAAARLAIPVEWGGDWRTFKDWGHFQLPWAKYP